MGISSHGRSVKRLLGLARAKKDLKKGRKEGRTDGRKSSKEGRKGARKKEGRKALAHAKRPKNATPSDGH
jgi:hypothetical protein